MVKNAAVGTGCFTQFAVEEDLPSLSESICNKNKSLDIYIYQDKYILIKDSSKNGACFLIEKIEK